VTSTGFASVVIDVDSTLCGVEGIDWLAEQRGGDVGRRVAQLTDRAMRGEIALDAVYGERLAIVSPTLTEVRELARVYVATLAAGAADAVQQMRRARRRVVLVSGGLREAILPVAAQLGVAPADLHAVSVRFGPDGRYSGYDTTSPLATADGKGRVVRSLDLPRRILAVGDGATDLAMRADVDAFAAFTGFVRREAVVAAADLELERFDQLVELALA
jgi:phosphoserine phosphatase